MKKMVTLILILVFVIGLIYIFLFVNRIYNQKEMDNYHKQDINEYYLHDGWLEIGYELAKKDNDWSKLPLSSNFKKKYNSKDGILGEIKFDNIKYRPYADTNKNWYFKEYYTYFVISQGKRQLAYHYEVVHEEDYDNWIDDIKILNVFEIVDENGNEKEVKRPFNKNTKRENIDFLVHGGVEEFGVAVTDKFHKKYPFFLDLFIHYSPLSYNGIEFLEQESDLDNNIAVFEVNSILECKKRKYEVKLVFDDNLYLDDAEVKLVKEEDYRGDKQYITAKVIYSNSNWDSLELTNSFREKYNNTNGIMEDIDNINIDIEMDSQTIVINKEYINTFVDLNGNKISYKFEFVDDEKGWVDDIKITKV